MPITAAAVYDARTRTTVAVAASPPAATPAILLTIATFTQHVDNVGAAGVASTPAQVAAAWAGPPAITYVVVAARYRALVLYTSVAGDVDPATDADAALHRLSRVVAIDAAGLAAEGAAGGDATGRVWAAVKECLAGDELAGVPLPEADGALIARGANVLSKLHLPGGGDRGGSGSGGGGGHALARVASLRASGALGASAVQGEELPVTTQDVARRHSMNARDSSDSLDGEGEADGPERGAKGSPSRGRIRGLLHGGKKKTLAALRPGGSSGGGGAPPREPPRGGGGSPRSSGGARGRAVPDTTVAAAVDAPTPRTPTTTLTVSPVLWADAPVGAVPPAQAAAGDLAWLAGVLRGEAPIRAGEVAPPIRRRALPAATGPSSTAEGGAAATAATGELGGGGALAIAPPPPATVAAEVAAPAVPMRRQSSAKLEDTARGTALTRTPVAAAAGTPGARPPIAATATTAAPAPTPAGATTVVAAPAAPVSTAASPPLDPAAAAAAEFDAAITANDLTAAMTSITNSLRRLSALPASAPGVASTTAAAVHLATGVRLLARHDAAVAAAGPTPPRPSPSGGSVAPIPPHPKALEAAALAQHLAALPLGASPPLARKAARAGAASNFAVGNYGVAAALIRRLLADGPPAAAATALRRRLDECGAAGGGDVGRVPTPGRVDWAGLGKLGGGGRGAL
ncbi:hypothetical protein MMPV_007038 [Pyropia vietnamensis]